ncbi:MAG: hypothetical protein JJV98_12460 [Desulfosarcina sp.]|nr:hypothetical protein [Desulfobacterales bacterium]
MIYGAYYRRRQQDIVWFRTSRPLETGFYHRRTHHDDPPDVYIAESVPALIMQVYPWIHEEQAAFQHQAGSPGLNAEVKDRISEKLTGQLVQRLDPDDDTAWVDEPRWVKHLQPDGLGESA